MKATLGAGALSGLIIFGAQAPTEPDAAAVAAPAPHSAPSQPLDWSQWSSGFGPPTLKLAAAIDDQGGGPILHVDVVDAHWMALTMWGEARGGGEAAMRAVGHVIDNRRRLGRHGDFVTDTVSEAWQFSCWNEGDPNRRAIERIDDLPRGGHDRAMWLAARRVADEILSGRSQDPTGGALFYHEAAATPRWSAGIAPVAQVGGHLFFRHAR